MATTAYTIVAIETIQQRDAIRETNPARLTCQAIQRALLCAGRKVLQNFQLLRPMEIHGWQTLHQLYALAEFDDEDLVLRTCEFAFSGSVKSQNAPFVLRLAVANRRHGP